MKSSLLAAALALFPAAFPAFGQQLPAAPASSAKTALFDDIAAWRGTQLPSLTPPDPITAEFGPRLDAIKAEVQEARGDSGLAGPRKELDAWIADLARRKYPKARAQGQTRGTSSQYLGELKQEERFSFMLQSALAQQAAERSLVESQQRAMSAAVQNPARFFDGARFGAPAADPSVVSAAPPLDPKDPARYAKVRQILISQGASRTVVDMAIKEAIRQNADPLLVLAVINQESGFHTRATSPCGARGLMQIMPGTGRGLGVRDASRLYDAQTNLRAGIRFLNSLWGKFVGGDMSALAAINPFSSHDVKSAVAAYNAGPGAVERYDGVPPYRETQGYVKNVLGYYSRLKQYMSA
jgi:soluble lytic murein transglycosylase-like protein